MKRLSRIDLHRLAGQEPFLVMLEEPDLIGMADRSIVNVVKIEPYYNDQWGDGAAVTMCVRREDGNLHTWRERNPILFEVHPLVQLARIVDEDG